MMDKYIYTADDDESGTEIYINADMIVSITAVRGVYRITMTNNEVHQIRITDDSRKRIAEIINQKTGEK